jgi:hypothetical protein
MVLWLLQTHRREIKDFKKSERTLFKEIIKKLKGVYGSLWEFML